MWAVAEQVLIYFMLQSYVNDTVGETWLNNMTEYLYGKTPKVCKNKYVKIAC